MTARLCVIDGCTRPHLAHGWCKLHYGRWWRRGDPLAERVSLAHTLEQSVSVFWSQVDRCGTDECWLWTGRLNSNGYGRMTFVGRERLVHHVAWELAGNAPIPDLRGIVLDASRWLSIDHICHNRDRACVLGDACPHRRCVNPAHLELKTKAQNASDGQRGRPKPKLRGNAA